MKEMAGWGARGRPPFQGTVAPRVSPQPTVSIVRRSMEAFHGPLATSKGVRLFGTDALRYQPLDPAVAITSLFQTRPHYGLCDPADRCRQM